MRKNHYRDYATEAFRFYAIQGGCNAYRQRIWNDAVLAQHETEGRSGIANPSEAAVLRAEKELERAMAEIQDLDAVEKTIIQIEHMRCGRDIMTAIRMVYMADPEKDIEKGEISERVHKAELSIPASERSIYGWLAMGRRMFAETRGLRL